MNACCSYFLDGLALRHDNQLRFRLQLCHIMSPFNALREPALTLVRITPGVSVAVVSYAHCMAMLIAFAATDLKDAKIFTAEECDLCGLLEALASALSTTLSPCVVAPGEKPAVLRDTGSIVQTSYDLLDRSLDLSDKGRYIRMIFMSTQTGIAEGIKSSVLIN